MAPATLVAASSARSSTFRWCDPEEDAVLAAAVADFEAARLEAGRCAAEASADSALCASEKARQKALAELATQRQEVVRLRKELTDAQREAKLLSSVEQRLRDELRGNELALHSAVKRGARALRAAALASGAAVPPKVPETLASAANVRWVEAALDMAVDCVLGSRERAAAAAAANALGSDASTASGAADLSAGSWSTGSSSASSGGLAHAAGLLSPRGVVLPAAGALAATFATTPSRLRSPSPAHVTPQRPARPRRPSSRGPKRVSLVTDDDFPEPDERQPPATTLVQEALPQSAGNSEASLLAALRSELHEARLAAATAAGAEEGRVLQEERVAAGLRSEVAALAAELRENARLEDEAARGLSQCRADLTSMEEACTQAVVLAEEGAVRRLRHAESAAEGDREERAEQAAAETRALRAELGEEALALRTSSHRAEEREWRHQALLQHATREMERVRADLRECQEAAAAREEALEARVERAGLLASQREVELSDEREGFRALVRAQLAEMAPRAAAHGGLAGASLAARPRGVPPSSFQAQLV